MSADPIIADSARKHGVTDEDILHAYRHPIRLFELDEGFTLIIGRAGPRWCTSWEWSKVPLHR